MLRLFIAPSLVLTLLAPFSLGAAEPPLIRIDASEVPEAEDAREAIEDAVLPTLGAHGVALEDVRIKIIWLDANDFVAGIYASVDPDIDPLETLVVKCPEVAGAFCTPAKLPSYVRRAVDQAIADRDARLRATVSTSPGHPTPEQSGAHDNATAGAANPSETTASNVAPDAKPSRKPKPRGLRPLGRVGVAGLVLGTASMAVGIPFIAVGQTDPLPSDMSQVLKLRLTGYFMTSLGAAAVVTGAILLALDRREAKRSIAWQPLVGPDRAMFAIHGRF